MRLVLLVVLAACAHAPPRGTADAPTVEHRDATRRYTIWLAGSRVGSAVETESWSPRGLSFARRESLRFLRGDSEVRLTTEIVVDADLALHAHHVRWTETGAETRTADALREPDGWHIANGTRDARPPASGTNTEDHVARIVADADARIVADAEPAELIPLLVRRDGHFTGAVFLPARGFVAGHGTIAPIEEGSAPSSHDRRNEGSVPIRLIARLALDAGPLVEATIDLGDDGTPARVVDGEGVIAVRATEAQLLEDFPSVDLISATAVAVTGTRSRTSHLVIDGDLALPAVPGQRRIGGDALEATEHRGAVASNASAGGIELELGANLAGALPDGERGRDRTNDIKLLVTAVRSRITPSLSTGPASTADADAATAGDCTTFALAYASLAHARGIPTRIVTGLRVDSALGAGARLVRHRWAVSWTGTRWIAIDAAFDQAPAGGDLVGLALHEADDAGLVAGDATLTRVRTAAWVP